MFFICGLSGVKTHTTMDDLFSELGSVQKDMDHNVVIKLLTKKPETSQVEKPELSQVRTYVHLESPLVFLV